MEMIRLPTSQTSGAGIELKAITSNSTSQPIRNSRLTNAQIQVKRNAGQLQPFLTAS